MASHWDVLYNLLKNKDYVTIAEIGAYQGKLTKYILDRISTIEKYYVIDPWKHYPEWDNILDPTKPMLKANMNEVFTEFKRNIRLHRDRIEILKMNSSEAIKHIPDKSLDFVFIDANHAYEFVKEDIQLWTPKVKIGGIVSGHDYGIEYRKPRFGVTAAVNELIPDVKVKGTVWYDIKNEDNWLKK